MDLTRTPLQNCPKELWVRKQLCFGQILQVSLLGESGLIKNRCGASGFRGSGQIWRVTIRGVSCPLLSVDTLDQIILSPSPRLESIAVAAFATIGRNL